MDSTVEMVWSLNDSTSDISVYHTLKGNAEMVIPAADGAVTITPEEHHSDHDSHDHDEDEDKDGAATIGATFAVATAAAAVLLM